MQTKSFTEKQFILIYLASLIVAVILGLVLEYVYHVLPCELCIYERYIFYAAIPLLILSPRNLKMGIIVLTAVSSIIISSYHSLIEFKIIEPIFNCKVPADIKDILKNMPDCSERSFQIAGLSLANINFIYHTFVLWIVIFIKRLR